MHDELVFLGLEAPVKDSKSNPLLKSEANRQRRKVLQKQHEEEYQQALVNTKEKYDEMFEHSDMLPFFI